MAKRIFRIEFGNNGAELVIGKVDEKFVEYWRNKSSDELVEFLNNWDFRDPNEPVDKNIPLPRESFNAWNEIDDIEHANNCYSDAGIFINEVKENDLYSRDNEQKIEPYHLYEREAYFDEISKNELEENAKKNKQEIVSYVPVMTFMSTEKGDLGCYFVETNGEDFDVKKLAYSTLETNMTSLIDKVWYDKKELYVNTDNSGSTGKGSFARVGFMNTKWHDKFNKPEEELKEYWESYDSQ
tara:strand:- start:1872 stop:2591 length:720 start_codon:yes stop_codon:yes gene_type:complete